MATLSNLSPVLDDRGRPVMSAGNFAVVFKMKSVDTGRCYAIKCFIKDQEGRAEAYQRISEELEFVSSPYLLHVQYLENELFVDTTQTEQEEFPVLKMEWMEGKPLDAYLRENIYDSYALEMLTYRFCRMGAFLLSQPFGHGDLKPDNLMLSENEKLYLIDLGSAVNGYEDRVQVLCGTDGFAAPEQYQGRICASSDIYGLGKTLEVLGGRKKWRYFFLRPDFVLFLLRCCRKDPRHRYQDMEAVRRRLEILSGKKKRKKLVWVFLLLGTVAGYVSFSLSPAGKICFDDALSRTTEGYYTSVFLEGDAEDRKQVCEDMEDRLQKLLENYREKECQRRLLLLLAANSELMERPDRAAVYYEQLLLYDPEFGEGYTEYGLFLCRQNRKEAARKLWKRYQQMLGESDAEPGNATKVRLWQKEVEESDEKEKEKPDV